MQEWLDLSLEGWQVLNQPTHQAAAATFKRYGPPVLCLLPTGSLPKVLQHLRDSGQPGLVLAPLWEAQVWFTSLASQADWVAHVPWALRQQFCNLPSVWGRSKLALWGVNL